jgi:hypothetical protein
MAYYQLSPEVGQQRYVVASGANSGTVLQEAGEFSSGQELKANSISTALPLFGAGVPVSLYKEKPTEIKNDLFGTARAEQTLSLFNYTDDYAFREDVYVSEIRGLNETGDGDIESAKWAQLQDTLIEYSPLPTGYIQYDAARRAVRVELAKSKGGFQRARISTKKRFRYQTGRVVRSSVCLQMSLTELPACEKLWGIGDSLDGFFFQIIADGEGDNFRVVHRRSSGDGLTKEVIVPRSSFNGDKLDGTGSSNASIDFTKNCMYLVEWGWYGASSARFYAFVIDEAVDLPVTVSKIPRGRWVLMHELLIPDSLDAPSLGTPSLPFTIEISNTGYLVEPQYIIKYGLSLQIDGGETEKADMRAADISEGREIGPVYGGSEAAHFFPVFGLRGVDFAANQILNSQQALPKTMDVFANYRTEIAVIKDPVFRDLEQEVGHINGTLPRNNPGDYGVSESLLTGFDSGGNAIAITTETPDALPLSAQEPYTTTDMGTIEGNFTLRQVVAGKTLATFYAGSNKGERIDLTRIYDLVREAISTEYDSKFTFPVTNEDYQIESIAGDGTLSLSRKHTLELGFRFVIGLNTYYIVSIPSVSSIKISETKGGSVFTGFSGKGIVPGDFGTAFYDLVIDQAIASRARPIDQGAVIIAARRIQDKLIPLSFSEKRAEWMLTYGCSTSGTYNIVSPSPEVRVFLNYGLR